MLESFQIALSKEELEKGITFYLLQDSYPLRVSIFFGFPNNLYLLPRSFFSLATSSMKADIQIYFFFWLYSDTPYREKVKYEKDIPDLDYDHNKYTEDQIPTPGTGIQPYTPKSRQPQTSPHQVVIQTKDTEDGQAPSMDEESGKAQVGWVNFSSLLFFPYSCLEERSQARSQPRSQTRSRNARIGLPARSQRDVHKHQFGNGWSSCFYL